MLEGREDVGVQGGFNGGGFEACAPEEAYLGRGVSLCVCDVDK